MYSKGTSKLCLPSVSRLLWKDKHKEPGYKSLQCHSLPALWLSLLSRVSISPAVAADLNYKHSQLELDCKSILSFPTAKQNSHHAVITLVTVTQTPSKQRPWNEKVPSHSPPSISPAEQQHQEFLGLEGIQMQWVCHWTLSSKLEANENYSLPFFSRKTKNKPKNQTPKDFVFSNRSGAEQYLWNSSSLTSGHLSPPADNIQHFLMATPFATFWFIRRTLQILELIHSDWPPKLLGPYLFELLVQINWRGLFLSQCCSVSPEQLESSGKVVWNSRDEILVFFLWL